MNWRKKLWIFVTILVLYILFSLYNLPKGTTAHERISAAEDPVQTELEKDENPPVVWERSGKKWRITPRATYQIAARVLRTERYRWGWQSSISPIDLALGWGELADPKVDEWISWSQNNRWYFFRWNERSPYDQDFISRHSANVHIVPADENLKRAVLKIEEEDFVLLEGDLIDVDSFQTSPSYWWHTSLTREDTGDGSCELLWLKRAVFNGKEYH